MLMASNPFGYDDSPIVDINITPFVDVVLVLLVIFMVTAQFFVNNGMNIELPKANTTEQIQDLKEFNVMITRDESYFLNGKSVTLDELEDAAKEKILNKQNVSLTISADKDVVYGQVVRLMDALRAQGVTQFGLQLESSTTDHR